MPLRSRNPWSGGGAACWGVVPSILGRDFFGAALFARTAGACAIGALISIEYRINRVGGYSIL